MSDADASLRAKDGLLGRLMRGYGFLAESSVRRGAAYLRDVGDLVREGSVEPRLWVGSVERMWSGLAEDFGDYLRMMTNVDMSAAPIPTVSLAVVEPRGVQTVQELAFDIPASIFERAGGTTLTIGLQGLWMGRRRVLEHKTHFWLDPDQVTKGEPRCKLRLFDLPPGLLCGMTLVGSVCVTATEKGKLDAPLTVLIVEVLVS